MRLTCSESRKERKGMPRDTLRVMLRDTLQGQSERDAEWEEWFRQFMDSQQKGIPFDEPPPSRRKNGANRDDKPSDE